MGSKVMINNQNMVLFSVFDHCKELNFHLVLQLVVPAAECFATSALGRLPAPAKVMLQNIVFRRGKKHRRVAACAPVCNLECEVL